MSRAQPVAAPVPATAAVRLDKWLWAARLFKTRSQAKAAIESGHVRLNGARAKAAREVRPSDALLVRRGDVEYAIVVRSLAHHRGGAEAAAQLYEETAESIQRRQELRARRQAERAAGIAPAGKRPSKRDRRQLRAWQATGQD